MENPSSAVTDLGSADGNVVVHQESALIAQTVGGLDSAAIASETGGGKDEEEFAAAASGGLDTAVHAGESGGFELITDEDEEVAAVLTSGIRRYILGF